MMYHECVTAQFTLLFNLLHLILLHFVFTSLYNYFTFTSHALGIHSKFDCIHRSRCLTMEVTVQREEQEVRQIQVPVVLAEPIVKTREIVSTHPPMTVAKRVRIELSAVQDMLEQVLTHLQRNSTRIIISFIGQGRFRSERC